VLFQLAQGVDLSLRGPTRILETKALKSHEWRTVRESETATLTVTSQQVKVCEITSINTIDGRRG
jgi:hypothetical protein